MTMIIDIDENVFTRLFDNGTEDYAIVNDDLFAIAKSIRNGTPIPNATNEETIRALFPYTIFVEDGANRIVISKDWWNSPYRKGGTNEVN